MKLNLASVEYKSLSKLDLEHAGHFLCSSIFYKLTQLLNLSKNQHQYNLRLYNRTSRYLQCMFLTSGCGCFSNNTSVSQRDTTD